ncbi:MAG: hypothetical protein RLZZ118_652 [Bacteroidota bacterium]|jgi:hypothetical protein
MFFLPLCVIFATAIACIGNAPCLSEHTWKINKCEKTIIDGKEGADDR